MKTIRLKCWDNDTNSFILVELDMIMRLDGSKIIEINNTGLQLIQSTGLKDKNDKEIFEGDILNVIDFSRMETLLFIGKVDFIACHFSLKVLKGTVDFTRIGLGSFDKEEIEVIGNIFENKELLC